MANYYVVGVGTIITITILSLLYDSFSMDMYQCGAIPHKSSTGTSITRSFAAKKLGAFNINGSDVIVLLHIQKTGGSSFGRHMVHDLDLEWPCQCQRGVKACQCYRPGADNRIWLFSEFSVGWSCGLHADWTEMTRCVPSMLDKHEGMSQKRRYFYVTILRNPLARYLSEWQHVKRGATWKTSLHLCNGKTPSADELPRCYDGVSWHNVSLDEFMACQYNLANNRQTRMLADLTEVGCYNLSKLPDAERRAKLLESAKRNLNRLAFFGILEYQKETQALFESTFKLNFVRDFDQFDATKGTTIQDSLTEEQIQEIRRTNAEDFLLYDYAKKIFLERFASVPDNIKKRSTTTRSRKTKRKRRH